MNRINSREKEYYIPRGGAQKDWGEGVKPPESLFFSSEEKKDEQI